MSDIFETGYDSSLSRSSLNLDDGSSLIGESGTYKGALGSTVEGELEVTNLGSGAMASVLFTGKDTFASTTAGYRMGIDFSTDTYKWIIGDSTNHIDWNVTTANTLTITGALSASTITGGLLQTATSGARVVITASDIGSDVQANSIALYDRTAHVMFGVGTTNTSFGDRAVIWLDLDSSYAGDQQKGMYLSRNLAVSSGEYLLNILEDHASAASTVFRIQNDGSGTTIALLSSGNGFGLSVSQSGGGHGIYIDKTNSGYGLRIDSNVAGSMALSVNYSGGVQAVHFSSSNSGQEEADAVLKLEKLGTGNFRPMINFNSSGITIWYAPNGTDPNGTLSGTDGDMCFILGNYPKICTGTTNWTSVI